MKGILIFPLLLLLLGNGQKQIPNIDDSNSMLVFCCDKTSYSKGDTINLTIKNVSASDIEISLRADYIEMFCQQEENGTWSRYKALPFENLRCMTETHTILPNDTFRNSFSDDYFDNKGRFRFLLKARISQTENSIIVSTNSFTFE